MSIASISKRIALGVTSRIVDALWTAGGIGAAAELGCEDFGAQPARSGAVAPGVPACAGVRGASRASAAAARMARLPVLEGELCRNPVVRRSVR